MFHHTSKHLEACQKYSLSRGIFDSLLSVQKSGQTLSLVFDILRHLPRPMWNQIDRVYNTYLPIHYTSFVKKQQTKDNFCYIETGKQIHEIILITFALLSR